MSKASAADINAWIFIGCGHHSRRRSHQQREHESETYPSESPGLDPPRLRASWRRPSRTRLQPAPHCCTKFTRHHLDGDLGKARTPPTTVAQRARPESTR
ncbi:MAG: hypothetical protein E6J34_07450 [Chloroflexi bacterium]|nr:MAG: hypothetical protein E6J34_07450 [Chloroflexota bacterium]